MAEERVRPDAAAPAEPGPTDEGGPAADSGLDAEVAPAAGHAEPKAVQAELTESDPEGESQPQVDGDSGTEPQREVEAEPVEERPNLVPIRVESADDTAEIPLVTADTTNLVPIRVLLGHDTEDIPLAAGSPADEAPPAEEATPVRVTGRAKPAVATAKASTKVTSQAEVATPAEVATQAESEAPPENEGATEGTTLVDVPPSAEGPAQPDEAATPADDEEAAPAGELRPVPRTSGIGQAPWILALSSSGVLLVALGYAGGRSGHQLAPAAYWIGQIVVFTPVVARLLTRRRAATAESFTLVIGLAVNQYLLKWCYSPDQFRFPDELQHWLATTIINRSGDLFRPNLALPPAVHFPGLAEMGAAVSQLTGLPVTAAGIVVAGVCHLGLVAGLYLAVLRASRSAAIAGVTCVVYATSLHYLFFNSMYLYQTAALAFLMLTIWASRRLRAGDGRQFAVLTVAGILVTTICHHVTAGALVLTLLLIGAAEIVTVRPRPWKSLIVPGIALAVVAFWILVVARDVIAYLDAPLHQVLQSLAQFGGRHPVAAGAPAPPLWQLGIQALGLLFLLALFLAVAQDTAARRSRDPWLWAALAGSVVFFAGNGVRFLGSNGPEIAGRLSTFTYVPMSIVAAVALVRAVRLRRPERKNTPEAAPTKRRLVIGTVLITVLMAGARVGGWPPAKQLLPGPYLADGFERSVDRYGTDAADWEDRVLGPGQRTGGDLTAIALGSTYGRQDPVRGVGPLFYADQWSDDDQTLADQLALRYLVVDRRLAGQAPAQGQYFDDDPSGERLTASELGKFDALPQWSRLYDNGQIRIYQVGG